MSPSAPSQLALLLTSAVLLPSCSEDASTSGGKGTTAELRFRSDVALVTDVADAVDGVFIPPFEDCRDPVPGDSTSSPSGKVCTNVAISGCTEEGKAFADHASCDVVRTQRPFWPAPAREGSSPDDPRLGDAAFLAELTWAKEQISASGCACCHDSKVVGGPAAQWDISAEPIWLDTLSDTGLALFTGLADSSVLGAYPAAQNHGFDRSATGIPTTDTERMKAFTLAELARRGITEEQARAVPPFGGPIYDNAVRPPGPCRAGEGVDVDGRVFWTSGPARYVYVSREGSPNPGVPPSLDLPEGTVWRLDVLPSAMAVASGLTYGTTPKGSYQFYPEATKAPPLVNGERYHLTALYDVAVPLASCLFTFGDAVDGTPPVGDGGAPPAGGGFGVPCTDAVASSDCTDVADYCAVMPGQPTGYCTRAGCKDEPSLCPAGWSCLELSLFQADLPAICAAP